MDSLDVVVGAAHRYPTHADHDPLHLLRLIVHGRVCGVNFLQVLQGVWVWLFLPKGRGERRGLEWGGGGRREEVCILKEGVEEGELLDESG